MPHPSQRRRVLWWRRKRANPTVANKPSAPSIARRTALGAIAGACASLIAPRTSSAAAAPVDQWIASFRSKAVAHGITDDTYTRVMAGVQPDTTGLEAIRNQPEFSLKLWQYLNRA